MEDEEIQYGYVPQAQSSTWTFVVIGVVFAAVIGSVYASMRWERIVHAFPPAVTAYDQESQDAALRAFMTDTFPKYIIAVSKRDQRLREEAAAKMSESVTTLPRIAWHAKDIDLALDAFEQWSESSSFHDGADAAEALDDVNDAFFALELTLREMKAPYAVDAEIRARKDKKGNWRLRAIGRTSEVWRRTTFRAGGEEVVVSRQRRIDGLAVADLVHGKAKGGIALVLIDNALPQIANRYLPALVDGELRGVYNKDAGELPNDFVRSSLTTLLPPDVQDKATEIGAFAVERRALLEEIAQLSSSEPPRWLRTSGFWLEDWLYQLLKRRVLRHDRPELVARLAHYRAGTDFDPPLVRAVKRANDALLDAFLVGVERHEAWHLLLPHPITTENDIERPELLAYLGAIASAGDEFVVTFDKTLVKGKRAKASGRKGRTPWATGVLHGIFVDETIGFKYADNPTHAPSLAQRALRDLFLEERRARRTFVDSTILDPYPESLVIRPEPKAKDKTP